MPILIIRWRASYLVFSIATLASFSASADDAPRPNPIKVVMVDEYGANDEQVKENRTGETYPLRKWIAASDVIEIDVRHIKIDQLDARMLAGSRMVVIAGIPSPATTVQRLRQFVERGGSLIVAAGGGFDQASWNKLAWLRGEGILPAPLESITIGAPPGPRDINAEPFRLRLENLAEQPYFYLKGTSTAERRRIFDTPLFERAVKVRLTSKVDDELKQTKQAQPQVLARFDIPSRAPYLVERQIGRGKVLFISSGLKPVWNTMSLGVSVLAYDRILRGMAGLPLDPVSAEDGYEDLQPGQPVANRLNAGVLDDEGWCRARSRFGKYAVDLPGHYADTMLRINGNDGNFIVMHQLMAKSDIGGQVAVGFMEMHGESPVKGDPFEDLIRQNKQRGTLAGQDKIDVAGREADHLSIASEQEVGDAYRIKTRMGDYLIMFQFPKNQSKELDRVKRRVLASFQMEKSSEPK